MSGHFVFINPPWKIAKQCIEHMHRCHAKDPLHTKAVIVLPDWHTFASCTKHLKLYKVIPAGQCVFTRSPEEDHSVRDPVNPTPWAVNYWVMDETTAIPDYCSDVVPETSNEETLPTKDDAPGSSAAESDKVADSDKVVDAAAEWLPTAAAYVIMDPNHPEPLMRLPIDLNGVHVDALVDNAATLNFISKEFVEKNDMLKHCKAAPKVAVRVANSQRLSSSKILIPEILKINDIDYCGIQFRVLPHLKAADVILGLPAQKAMDMIIRPKNGTISIAGIEVSCSTQDRRVSCLLTY